MHATQALLPQFVAKAKYDDRFYRGFLEPLPMPGMRKSRTEEDTAAVTELAILQSSVARRMQELAARFDTEGGPFEFFLGPMGTMVYGDEEVLAVSLFCEPADGVARQMAIIHKPGSTVDNPETLWWMPSWTGQVVKVAGNMGSIGTSDTILGVLDLIKQATGLEVDGYPHAGIYGDAAALDGPLNTVMRTVR